MGVVVETRRKQKRRIERRIEDIEEHARCSDTQKYTH